MKFIAVDDLPNTIFLQGRLVNNIGKARILTRKEKLGLQPGSPDIRLELLNGESKMITRIDLMEKCRDHTGNKIKFTRIKDGKEFKITIPSTDLSTIVGIFHVPRKIGYKFTVNRRMLDGTVKRIALPMGHFVVYVYDSERRVFDRRYPLVVNKQVFDKMFIIAEKNMELANQRIKTETVKYMEKHSNKSNKAEKDKAESEKTERVTKTENKYEQNRAKSNQKGPVMLKADPNAPYVAVKRIVKAGTFDTVIGYTISDGKRAVDLELSKVMVLCRQKKIKNMCLVRNNNNMYLRGVGVRLDTLETTFR